MSKQKGVSAKTVACIVLTGLIALSSEQYWSLMKRGIIVFVVRSVLKQGREQRMLG